MPRCKDVRLGCRTHDSRPENRFGKAFTIGCSEGPTQVQPGFLKGDDYVFLGNYLEREREGGREREREPVCVCR